MAANDFSTVIDTWNPDFVAPQLGIDAPSFSVKLSASTTYPKGTCLGELTATKGTFAAYVDAAVDGTGVFRAILARSYITDSGGKIFMGSQASEDIPGAGVLEVPAYFGGVFKQTDLVGFDAAALADFPGAKVLRGRIADGDALIQF